MDNFTGLDVNRATVDITTFRTQSLHATGVFSDACVDFMNQLYEHWASPRAAMESKNFISKMAVIDQEIYAAMAHIYNGAIDAASMLASANGINFTTLEKDQDYTPGFAGDILADFQGLKPCEENKLGAVGMAVETVKLALDVFIGKLNEVINLMDTLPTSIAFYSPDGDMVNAYSTNVSEYTAKVVELKNELSTTIKTCMETEINNILLAKQNATDTLNA